MVLKKALIIPLVMKFANRLRFRGVFFLLLGLFILDFIVPDLIPFADELLLGLATLLFGMWKKKPGAETDSSSTPSNWRAESSEKLNS